MWSERLQLNLAIDRGDGRITSGSFLHLPYHNWERIDMPPLSQRGWVLQEQILVPRILHFDRREVFWECCQAVASENLPRGWPSIDNDKMDKVAVILARKRLNPLTDNLVDAHENDTSVTSLAGEDLHYMLWFTLVLKYSTCQLSYESDRLVAISGVARYLKTINKDQYVAGLWRRHLERELAWSTIRPLPADTSHLYYAPSFSWTSLNGFIEPATHITSGKPLVQVQPVHMPSASNPTTGPTQRDQPFQQDVFGPISEPTVQIKVTGQLKSMSMFTYDGSWYLLPSGSSSHSPPPPPPNDIVSTVENDAFEAYLDHAVENAQVASFQAKTLYYMPWVVYETRNVVQCCLIFEAHDQNMRQFRRIGICKPHPAYEHKSSLLLRDDSHRDLLPGYDEKTKLHTIYII